MARKTFDALAVGSLISGVALQQGMGRMQELVEHLAGHPVWTHELVDEKFVARMRQRVLDAYPNFPPEVVSGNWRGYADEVTRLYPEGLGFDGGADERTESPVESLMRLGTP